MSHKRDPYVFKKFVFANIEPISQREKLLNIMIKIKKEKLSIIKLKILQIVEVKPLNIKEITKKLSRDKIISNNSYQTVYRHIHSLNKKGYVSIEKLNKGKKGRPIIVKIKYKEITT